MRFVPLDMDYDIFGIALTILIVGCMFAYIVIEDNWLELDLTPEHIIPELVESEERLDNAYYDWCAKMNIECP